MNKKSFKSGSSTSQQFKLHKSKKRSSNFNKKNDNRVEVNIKEQIKKHQVGLQDNVFVFSSALSVSEFAAKINKTPVDIVKILFTQKSIPVTLNTILTEEQICELCVEFGYDFEKKIEEVNAENILNYLSVKDDPKNLVSRPPIVTIMGHVDHGKTSLLDNIRKTNVIGMEHGGITQHIGSYQVTYNDQKITFLDTPGHEAFTKMRSRGASITDIVILVIAADDGVKPQTVEAIQHTLAANVKMIVFINKMDKPEANPDLVKSQLYDHNIVVEDLGGNVMCIQGSVKNNQGINELLEAIILVAELMDLKANPNRLAYGTVIESHLDKGYGPLATLIVQNGTLIKGDFLVVSSTSGRVRIMHNDQLMVIETAGPSVPVKVAGLLEVPEAGDKFLALKVEKDAKMIQQKNAERKWKERIFNILNANIKTNDGDKKVNIIVKADVRGSLEAIKNSLAKINVEKVYLNLISSNTGAINESDLKLAKISQAVIFGFNIKPSKIISEIAQQDQVMIRFHNVIYKLLDEIKQLLLGALDPVEEEIVLGEALVQQIWRHSKFGTIAGCKVISGKVKRNSLVRLIRDQVVIYNSKIISLKHQKNDIKEALVNTECGIIIENFADIKENDILEVYEINMTRQHQGLSNNDNNN